MQSIFMKNNIKCFQTSIEQMSGGIPSQFPVQEDTQFFQILKESLDFFGIPEERHKEFFLVNIKTRKYQMQCLTHCNKKKLKLKLL